MAQGRPRLPKGVWALGFVSMFMDISSEMIHALLPVFLVTVLGATPATVGLIEGVGEATASITKLFSGWVSDRFGNRKLLAIVGYSLGALSKPFFAMAPSPSWVLGARFSDRVGKGIRGAPRDAMVAEMTPTEQRGAAYGLRQALDNVGAFTGPLIAIAMMAAFNNQFRLVFSVAIVPGLIAVAVLFFGVHEPKVVGAGAKKSAPISLPDLKLLDSAFWTVVAIGSILTLARFSEAFLILRVQSCGLPLALIPLVLIVMNIVYSLSAYPMGVLSDRVSRHTLLGIGFLVLIVSDLLLAFAPNVWVAMLGVAVWGLHMGMTQGVLSALVADTAAARLRGTAFGLFNLVTGVALLLASLIAGMLWQRYGPATTFFAGVAFTTLGLVCSVPLIRGRRPKAE